VSRLPSLVFVLLTGSQPSRAADLPRVALLLPSCELPGAAPNELRQAVALDLQLEGVVLLPPGALSPERDLQLLIEASCPAPDELTLRAELGAEQRRRTVRLSELALEQRPRALSLALSELVSLVLRQATQPPPLAPSAEPPPPVTAPARAPDPPLALPAKTAESTPRLAAPTEADTSRSSPRTVWRLGFAPRLRFFDGTSLWGAEAQLSRARWRYGAGLLMARGATSSGVVWTRHLQASAAYAFPLLNNAAGAALGTGPRVGVGYTFMSAHADATATAYDARDWYVDAAWTAHYSAPLSGAFQLGLGAELGYARGPIGYGDGLVIARTSGLFAAVALDGSLPL
jgi:hypothetical protein